MSHMVLGFFDQSLHSVKEELSRLELVTGLVVNLDEQVLDFTNAIGQEVPPDLQSLWQSQFVVLIHLARLLGSS